MTQEKQSIFEFHTGFTLYHSDDNSTMDCPFCGASEKFYFNRESLWDCKSQHCKRSGNAFSFIRQLYDHFDTGRFAAERISELRGIPIDVIQRDGIKWNNLNNSFHHTSFQRG
jgi:hypothetical protein